MRSSELLQAKVGIHSAEISPLALIKTKVGIYAAVELLSLKRVKSSEFPRYKLLEFACEVYDTTNERLLSKARDQKKVVFARKLSMYLIKKLNNHSLTSIGKYIRKDHSTVLFHIRDAEHLLTYDKEFIEKYREAMEMVKAFLRKE